METLIEQGPLVEETWQSGGLDLYKLTMSQFMYERLPDKQVTFSLRNRGQERLADYVDPAELKERLDFIRSRGWSEAEIAYFREIKDTTGESRFTEDFLSYLQNHDLPEVNVELDEATNDLAIDTTGQAPLVTFWETIVMSQLSELYFSNYVRANGLDLNNLYTEVDRRLDDKVAYLQAHDDVKLAEFSTRRRFSLRLQKHVLGRLAMETPNNLIGTSNIALSHSQQLKPVGTFAHELPMIYAALADIRGTGIRDSQEQLFEDWSERYPDLTSILPDAFTSDFTFSQVSADQLNRWSGWRQDSGNPLAFGEKAINLYKQFGIDPKTKNVMFSDSLHLSPGSNSVEPIRSRFRGRLGFLFGIGTDIGNDTGLRPLNIVMKATEVYDPVTGRQESTVKLSDDPGKEQGNPVKIAQYRREMELSHPESVLEGEVL